MSMRWPMPASRAASTSRRCPTTTRRRSPVSIAVKGIGRWSAEIYLLFADGRGDVFPAGDLAVQIELGRILGLDARPTEKRTRDLAEPFRPDRGALAVFLWHHYMTVSAAKGMVGGPI